MFRFLAIVTFSAVVLAISYWFVLLPDRWTDRLMARLTGKQKEHERHEVGWDRR